MLKMPIMIMIVIGFKAPKFVLTQTMLYIKHTFQNFGRLWPLVKVASYLIVINIHTLILKYHCPCCCGFERLYVSETSGPQKANWNLISVESRELKKHFFGPMAQRAAFSLGPIAWWLKTHEEFGRGYSLHPCHWTMEPLVAFVRHVSINNLQKRASNFTR